MVGGQQSSSPAVPESHGLPCLGAGPRKASIRSGLGTEHVTVYFYTSELDLPPPAALVLDGADLAGGVKRHADTGEVFGPGIWCDGSSLKRSGCLV